MDEPHSESHIDVTYGFSNGLSYIVCPNGLSFYACNNLKPRMHVALVLVKVGSVFEVEHERGVEASDVCRLRPRRQGRLSL